MVSNTSFYIFSFGFIISVFFCSFFKVGITFGILLLFISLLVFLFSRFYLKGFSEGKRTTYLGLLFLALSIGVLRFEFADINSRDSLLQSLLGEKVVIKALVVQEPEKKENNVKLVVDFTSIKKDGEDVKIFGRALVKTSFYPQTSYGDMIEITGELNIPKNFLSEDGINFDYVSFLKKDGIFYQIDFAQVDIISSENGNFVKDKLIKIKGSFLSKIRTQISEPKASLLGGLLLGAKDSLGSEWEDKFRDTGLSHIVVLSGYNITIVAESIMKAFSFLPRFFSFSFGILSIILFSIMTGGSSTVVRASLMVVVLLFARYIRRDYDIKRILAFVAVMMIMINPKVLVFDSSFQLSFLATLALVFLSPIFSARLGFITSKYGLREVVASTLATQLFVLPLIIYKMNIFSLVFLPVNVLVLPFIPATMLFGFLSILIGYMSSVLAWPLTFLTYTLLSYELKVVDIFSRIPFSSVSARGWGIILVVIFYTTTLYWLTKSKKVDCVLIQRN